MRSASRVYGIEWPTLALLAVVYVLWVAIVVYASALTPWLAIPVLALVIAQHSSLQHETIHGHPLPDPGLAAALVFPAIGLAVPYGRFRDLHLAHHKDANLTDPYDDPESCYWDPEHVVHMRGWFRRLLGFNNTLLGRMLVGPALGQFAFMRTEWQLIRAGSTPVMIDWLLHGASVALVVAFVLAYGSLPLWAYLVAAYLGMSLLKIRTYLEHQAHELASGRSVIVEDRGPLALLFLNNNYHAVHHAHPRVAWYDLPGLFASRREHYLRRNRGYYYRSYRDIFARYLLQAKEPLPHPHYPRERRQR